MTGAVAGAGIDRLLAILDDLAAAGRTVRLWWRDDDLEQPTPALDALLEALGEHGIAPALATVAGRAVPAAVAALAGSPARVFVHGWTHANHAPAGARKSEFGPEREAGTRLAEIAEARRRLAALAGERALACFVPPWNRIGDDLLARLGETGIVALSGFAPAGRAVPAAAVPRLDTHVDLIDWRGDRLPLTAAAAAAALAVRIRSRSSAENHDSPVDGPIGILSHHLVTGAAAWRAWRPLLAALGGHSAVRWLDPAAALAAVGAVVGAASAPGPGPGNETRRMG
ncbi:polysaccharide deacetylase family protein [Thalassobaculum sp.]|uniref:polysaccharide deacetylase family protein n=1 Tax=Thalassobaculum sp. TaxID=2022740 RepID=UPI0032EEE956